MLLPGPDFHWVGPLALWDFPNIFLLNTVEDQKKKDLRAEPLALYQMLNPSQVIIALRS